VSQPVTLTFLGTGNFEARRRYWNSFVLDGTVLVEPSPTALPHLHRCGISVGDIAVVVISHFHPDHTFGWPFFVHEAMYQRAGRPLHVVGPPGVGHFLEEMMALGGIQAVHAEAWRRVQMEIVEVDGSWQRAGALRFRAVEVEHVPHLRCFGYLFECGDRMVGYSGDTHPCAGLDELAEAADVLVLECDGQHYDGDTPISHMNEGSMRALRDRHPDTNYVLTHIGVEFDGSDLDNVTVPEDFTRLTV
jgi:ribonuclease BN (tRNA processing enzyme)